MPNSTRSSDLSIITEKCAKLGGWKLYHKPGIYFGLPEKEYHADPSISTSAIKKLIQDPEEYWDQSFMNPNPPPREVKDHLARGTLWHCRILEPELYDQKYIMAPYVDADFADDGCVILRTVKDLKAWLDDNGVPYKKSLEKELLVKAVYDAYKLGLGEPRPYLFDLENARFAAMHSDKTVIWSREVYRDMLAAEAVVKAHPYFSKVFVGGMSEVSIFWIDPETGIPMKCRVDKLKPKVILDYKTLYVSRGKSARKAALDAIKYEHYDVQTAVYTIGVAHAVNMINAGTAEIWGDVPGAFIDEFRETPEKPFGFVFQKEDRPYTVRGLKVVRRGGDLYNVFGNGLFLMNQGLAIYQRFRELYGADQWFDPEGMIEVADHEVYYS